MNQPAATSRPIVFGGNRMPSLKPTVPNAATQLNSAAGTGPGAGGAATPQGVQQQLAVAQAQVPQQQQPPSAPPGFMPNSQGQVVYPPGQGPITEQVPPMNQMSPQIAGQMAAKVAFGKSGGMTYSAGGEGSLSRLRQGEYPVTGNRAWASIATRHTGRTPQLSNFYGGKAANENTNIGVFAGLTPFAHGFAMECKAAGMNDNQIIKMAQDCSKLSKSMAEKLATLTTKKAFGGGILAKGLSKAMPAMRGMAGKAMSGIGNMFGKAAPAAGTAMGDMGVAQQARTVGQGIASGMASRGSFPSIARGMGAGIDAAAGGVEAAGAKALGGLSGLGRGAARMGGNMARGAGVGYAAGGAADLAATQGLGMEDPNLRVTGARTGFTLGSLGRLPGRLAGGAAAAGLGVGGLEAAGKGLAEFGKGQMAQQAMGDLQTALADPSGKALDALIQQQPQVGQMLESGKEALLNSQPGQKMIAEQASKMGLGGTLGQILQGFQQLPQGMQWAIIAAIMTGVGGLLGGRQGAMVGGLAGAGIGAAMYGPSMFGGGEEAAAAPATDQDLSTAGQAAPMSPPTASPAATPPPIPAPTPSAVPGSGGAEATVPLT